MEDDGHPIGKSVVKESGINLGTVNSAGKQ
jgi:hypothetical protein